MPNQPGLVKRNAATELADMVHQLNADRGAPAGRMSGTPIQAISGPRVRSAEMTAGPRELTPNEVAELDAKARDIGILPAEDEGVEFVEKNMTPREILAAALPPVGTSKEEYDRTFPPPRESTRMVMNTPRLPDFTKIQMIDLIRNVAYVDTFEVPLPEGFVQETKGVILNLAVALVTKQLAEAMVQLNLIPPKESEETKSSGGPDSGSQIETPTEVQREREGNSETTTE